MNLSLRSRVVAGLVIVGVVLTIVAWLVTTQTRERLVGQIDDQLEAIAGDGRAADFDDQRRGRDDRLGDEPPTARTDGAPPERLSTAFEGFVGDDGTLTVYFDTNLPGRNVGRPDLDARDLPRRDGRPFTVDAVDGDSRWRAIAQSGPSGSFVWAFPLDDADETVGRLITMQALALGAVLVVLAVVGWWVVRLGIAPINSMTRTAARIASGGDLSVRLEQGLSGTEAGRLAETLNTMLARLEVAADERERSEERLRTFVADASHELRTPITTIRGYAELYQAGGLGEGLELDDAMARTRGEAERMGRLVADMLTLAKLDAARPIDQAPIDVAAIASDVVADARVTAPDRTIGFESPPGAAGRCLGDADRFHQAVANLVANAIRHTPAGSSIDVTVTLDDESVVLAVVDHGDGMAPDVLARATERFFRADPSRSRASGGTGLGLSIVRAIVEAHGGTLMLTSTEGGGTTATIQIPTRPNS